MTTPTRTRLRVHPSLPAMVFLLWGLLTPTFEGETMVNADGDPARHLRHGVTILERKDVIRADPFSFSRPGAEFVGFEYGSQVLLALAWKAGSLAGMVALTVLVIAGTLAFLTWWMIRRGVDPLLAVGSGVLIAILTNIHWLARPHVLSWPLIIALLVMLERPQRPAALGFAALFALWANIHGAFVYGWILMGLYGLGHLLESLAVKDPIGRIAERKRFWGLVRVAPLAVLATVVTPYGWKLPWHVVEYFRDRYIRDATQEFLSPDFHAPELLPFLLVLVLLVVLLARGGRLGWPHLTVLAGNLGMALISQRNIVLLALTSIPGLTVDFAPLWDRRVGLRGFRERFREQARTGVTIPYVLFTVLALGGLALARGRVAGVPVVETDFDSERFPVQAVARAREAGLQGRPIHEFIWGGYLVWAWPETRVFIDGGTDFYGGDLMKAHRQVMGLQPGWRDSLDSWRIDMALVNARGAMAEQLRHEPGWRLFYEDSTAVLFRR